MFKVFKNSSKLKVLVFVFLELNFIYAIGYLGHMIISSEYLFDINLLTITPLFYLAFILVASYTISSFFAKRVTWNVARARLDDIGGFGLLADEKTKQTPSLKDQISVYKNKCFQTIELMGDYDNIFMMVKFNYIIILVFSSIVTLFNYKKIDTTAYIFTEVFVLLFVAIATYILSNKAKITLKNILKELEDV
jgi:hypothetical protein